jgi:hypothetical protein
MTEGFNRGIITNGYILQDNVWFNGDVIT